MASPEHTYTPVSGDDRGSGEQSLESSANQSRESSKPPKPRKGVRFTPGGESLDSDNHRAAFDVRDDSNAPPRPTTKPKPFARQNPTLQSSNSTDRTSLMLDSPPGGDIANSSLTQPRRPALKRNYSSSSNSEPEEEEEDSDDGLEMKSAAAGRRAQSQLSAHDRGERLSRMMGSHSAPGSRTASPLRLSSLHSPPPSPEPRSGAPPLNLEDIPLEKLNSRRTYGIEDEPDEDAKEQTPMNSNKQNPFRDAAARLVRHHRRGRSKKGRQNDHDNPFKVSAPPTPLRSGQATPVQERHPTDYVPRPNEYREGFLSSILKLYDERGVGANLSHNPMGNVGAADHKRRRSGGSTYSTVSSPPHSETATPKRQKWYSNQQAASTGSMASLIHSATNLAGLGGSPTTGEKGRPQRPPLLKSRSASALDTVLGRNKAPRQDESIHIQVHIAETMTRQAYLMKMCKALMNYGAPTHRLEEQMRMSARVLEIDGQFLYIPGCMIISFDDSKTHTTEVKIVRTKQAIDLGKLREVHEIYKETLHDLIGVEEAMERLDQVLQREQQYHRWLLVPVYGLASACVGPFAFGARPIDLPMAFLLGCCLGIMQLIVAPKSELYSNIFEVTAAVLTSFLARAFGSIRDGQLFCFSALAQSSIALILPGYTVREYFPAIQT
ncbi:MAG: hypothetical protein Q9183_004561 [Haloplaca sp. 2 TL-2023]